MMDGHAPAEIRAPKGGWALVVDDHPLFCDALELTLRSIGSFTAIRAVTSLAAALDRLAEEVEAPSLILLDLNLPDVSGLDGLMRLKRAAGECPVIVVSSMADNTVIRSALRSGAAGFVPKHSRRSVFVEALDAIGRGETFTPQGFVEAADPQTGPDAAARIATLTAQQARILQLICEGKLNKQIAYDLSIAETTVKAHVTAIMRKLGVQRRTQAVLVAKDLEFAKLLSDPEQSS
ncbi:MAG: response regulator transcription factor [Pseudomonadota bacterium]